MTNILALSIGGALGALLRYTIAISTRSWWVDHPNAPFPTFPLGTFLANLLGAFLLGYLFSLFNRIEVAAHLKLLLTTGFLGALTTFSTYMLEVVNLYQAGAQGMAVLYFILSSLGGLLCVLLGLTLGSS